MTWGELFTRFLAFPVTFPVNTPIIPVRKYAQGRIAHTVIPTLRAGLVIATVIIAVYLMGMYARKKKKGCCFLSKLSRGKSPWNWL